jgi:hypothetical protein
MPIVQRPNRQNQREQNNRRGDELQGPLENLANNAIEVDREVDDASTRARTVRRRIRAQRRTQVVAPAIEREADKHAERQADHDLPMQREFHGDRVYRGRAVGSR